MKMAFEALFHKLDLKVHTQSSRGIQYFVKYLATENQRNTIKIDTQFPPPRSNQYEPVHFDEIDRTLITQTSETMVANKLVAVLDRWEHHNTIAGRDIYDIHSYLISGRPYNPDVIIERTDKSLPAFFADLIQFIEKRVNATVIQQDLNTLLPLPVFQSIRGRLKEETLRLLNDEKRRVAQN
jgi:hypothetical protein